MKSTRIILAAISNTIALRKIVLMMLFSFAISCFGQQVKENEKSIFENNETGEYELISFKCKNLEGKVYIMWTVIESSNECVYVLERSNDNKKYYRIYSEKGAKSPTNLALVNSFIDEKPLDGTSYYRVRRLILGKETSSNTYVMNNTTGDYILYATTEH